MESAVYKLNEYAKKTSFLLKYEDLGSVGPDHDKTFTQRVVLNGKVYPEGVGKTKKEAKQDAAKNALRDSHQEGAHQTAVENYNPTSAKQKKEPNQNDSDIWKALREVGTLSDLHNRNIVRYYTFWMEDSRYQGHITAGNSAGSFSSSQSIEDPSAKYLYIQMELCKTKTLTKWIKEKNTQSLQDSKRRQESVTIAQQIVSGVEYIHCNGHFHRDLKVTGKTYDRKVDIFALGLIYFELLWKLSTGHERGVTETAAEVPQKTATKVLGVLNENVPKDRVNMKAGQSTRQDPHDAPQCSSFVVDDKERPAVPGKSTKDAKEEAAE
ncbi:hypothetical protein JOQ06_013011, partial [Pogonophryne albipinna]